MTLHSHLLSRYHHLTVGKTSLPWQLLTMYYTHEKLFEDKHFLFGCAVLFLIQWDTEQPDSLTFLFQLTGR